MTDNQVRLSPEMASFRLLVLAFVRDYIDMTGVSPSYGEIASKMDSNRTRVRHAIKSLARDGLILRTPGPRGLKMPSMRAEAIRQLRELGWTVDEDAQLARSPVTNPPLLPPPVLDYVPERDPLSQDGEADGHTGGEAAEAGACRKAR